MIAIRTCALAEVVNVVSFEHDIRPLFRDSPDIDTMQGYGIDLSSYEDVKARAPRSTRRWPREHAMRRAVVLRAGRPVQGMDGRRHGPVAEPRAFSSFASDVRIPLVWPLVFA
jgi:hypothetical protein